MDIREQIKKIPIWMPDGEIERTIGSDLATTIHEAYLAAGYRLVPKELTLIGDEEATSAEEKLSCTEPIDKKGTLCREQTDESCDKCIIKQGAQAQLTHNLKEIEDANG